MATATAPAPAPKITPTLATTLLAEEQYIKFRWAALQRATRQLDDRGLEFGMAMYEYRAKHSAQGQRTDLVPSGTKLETFEAFCDRMRIARRTAYNWIARYEESIGKRPPERPPEPSNRELRRVAFKAEHPELAKRSNKEVDNEIYKTGFPTESRRCGGAAHATKEIEKHPELHPLAVEGYKLCQTCLETARKTKSARPVAPVSEPAPTDELDQVMFSTNGSHISLLVCIRADEETPVPDEWVNLKMGQRITCPPREVNGQMCEDTMPAYTKKTRALYAPHFEKAAKVFRARLRHMNLWDRQMQKAFAEALVDTN